MGVWAVPSEGMVPCCSACLTAGHHKDWPAWQGSAMDWGGSSLSRTAEGCWVASLFLPLQTDCFWEVPGVGTFPWV